MPTNNFIFPESLSVGRPTYKGIGILASPNMEPPRGFSYHHADRCAICSVPANPAPFGTEFVCFSHPPDMLGLFPDIPSTAFPACRLCMSALDANLKAQINNMSSSNSVWERKRAFYAMSMTERRKVVKQRIAMRLEFTKQTAFTKTLASDIPNLAANHSDIHKFASAHTRHYYYLWAVWRLHTLDNPHPDVRDIP